MKSILNNIITSLPFTCSLFVGARQTVGEVRPHLNIARVLESIFTVVLSGIFLWYVAFSKMEVTVKALETTVKNNAERAEYDTTRVEQKVDKLTQIMVEGYLRGKK